MAEEDNHIFFSGTHPLDNSLLEASDVTTGVAKMVPDNHSNRPDLDPENV